MLRKPAAMRENQQQELGAPRPAGPWAGLAVIVCVMAGLAFMASVNFLLFHALIEVFSVIVAGCIFVVAWNGRRFLDNSFLPSVGIAYLFVGLLDLLHTLAYKGMGVFSNVGSNLATQLWTAARYLEAAALLVGALLLKQKVRAELFWLLYAALALGLTLTIFAWPVYPACYLEDQGLTVFKKVSEYVICALFLAALAVLWRGRERFEPGVWRLLAGFFVLRIASELAFTLYVDVYGFFNIVGHLLKLAGFMVLYRAMVETGLARPYALLFRDLKRNEEQLEQRVAERTREVTEALAFERLVAELSARLNAPAEGLSEAIGDALRRLVEFFQADRGMLLEANADLTEARVLYCHAPSAAPPAPEVFQRAMVPWLLESARQRRTVCLDSLDDLPREAATDREALARLGTTSGLLLPVFVGQRLRYGLALDCLGSRRTWPQALRERLRLAGEVFGNALTRERGEQEAGRLRREFIRMDRMTRMGELTAAIAHELNQPLTAILSNAQAALRFMDHADPDPDQLREILKDIVEDDRRAGNVIRSLRSLVKRGTAREEPVDLNGVIQEVLALVHSDAVARKVDLRSRLAEDLPRLLGDKALLQQVLLNLLMNAVEAVTEQAAGARAVTVGTERGAAGTLRLYVRDTGPGLPPDKMERVFEPFFTTRQGGLGMGLAITASIVARHRGRIWAENNPAGGATFFVELPAAGPAGGQA
jgi:hypothetical protein